MTKLARQLWIWVATLLVSLVPRLGLANEPVVTTPRDVPILVQPASTPIPPVPAHFRHRDLGWLKVVYTPEAEERLQTVFRDADAVRTELGWRLGQPVLDAVELRVARTPEEMAQLGPGEVPYASGVAFPGLHLAILTLTAPISFEGTDLDEVFRHEMAHVALEDAVRGHHVPRWFNEGLAIHFSGETPFLRTKTLWDASLAQALQPLSELDQAFPEHSHEVGIAYAQSADIVRFLMRRSDEQRFQSLIRRMRDGQPFEQAIADAYGSDLRKLEYQWRETLEQRFSILPFVTGGSVLWLLTMVALVLAYVRRRRRAKAILLRWEREETAAIEAARALSQPPPEELPVVSMRPASLPRVHHDGYWHTLH